MVFKKFPNIYKKVAPILNPKTTTIVPIQGPKRKPPRRAMGEPKPKRRTQIIVPKKNIILDKIILLFLIPSKASLLALISS